MRKSILVGYIFVAIIFGITTGIIVHICSDSALEQATLKEVENANKLKERQQNIIQAVSTEIKTTPNTKIIYETLYNKCNDVETSEENIKSEDVNKNEDYFKNNRVKLSKEIDGICDKHYVIKEKDGYIAVFTLDSDGNENLKEVTDIVTQYLTEDDMMLLKNGIKVNGDNELIQTLSDFE